MKNEKVMIRCVTHYQLGRVVKITRNWIHLADGGWVRDTGKFSTALAKGELAQFDLVPGVMRVSRAAIVDILEWQHPLPTKDIGT